MARRWLKNLKKGAAGYLRKSNYNTISVTNLISKSFILLSMNNNEKRFINIIYHSCLFVFSNK